MTQRDEMVDRQARTRDVIAGHGVQAGDAVRAPRDDDCRDLACDRGEVVVGEAMGDEDQAFDARLQ